ncbi:MAG: fatty acid desaturase [Okeania sp. SIO2F4]|uniref:fatty acid desaturase family protein n=1 Tax=Okeania sp. SIO2F4 TaxID=2607790 RepID=UPI00142B0A65|nr:fatty acid desaturase [Okeania sp. SIO2F4]NES03074.1 fatty acid desaturase [Okeania sp. SIO2F4]
MSKDLINSTRLTQDLQKVTSDLHQINSFAGILRFVVLGFVFLSLVTIAWSTSNNYLFSGISIFAGLFYAFWLICTHDMTHHTLTGWRWFDSIIPRLISWPMFWPYSVYAALHKLHHGWNGSDLRDPERVQWTWQEYQNSYPLVQWYVRHQWSIDIFLAGGVGLILKTFIHGWRYRKLVSCLPQQIFLDVGGMILVHGVLLSFAITNGELLRYLLFWLILERVIGIVMQTRDHLEHYGLWGKAKTYQLTQLYASRNLKANSVIGWLMGGLNYHGVHHAFPGIPFNNLPEAFQRIQGVLKSHNLPLMKVDDGYCHKTCFLSSHPTLIYQGKSSEIREYNQIILTRNNIVSN